MKQVIKVLRDKAAEYRKLADEFDSVANHLESEQPISTTGWIQPASTKNQEKIIDVSTLPRRGYQPTDKLDTTNPPQQKKGKKRGKMLIASDGKRICPECGKPFDGIRAQVYCSVQCRKNAYSKEKAKEIEKKRCPVCHHTFLPKSNHQISCSRECSDTAIGLRELSDGVRKREEHERKINNYNMDDCEELKARIENETSRSIVQTV